MNPVMNKRVLAGLIVAILLAVGSAALGRYLDHKKELAYQASLISYQEPSLTPEAKKFYEQRLAASEKALTELKSDADNTTKFNAHMNVANAKFSLGFYAEARSEYEQALMFFPNDADTLHIYSTGLAAMKDYKAALAAILKAIDQNPKNPDFWKWRIALEKDHFNSDNGYINDLYVQALNKTENEISMVTAYAKFAESIGNLQVALDYWQKAIIIEPVKKSFYQPEVDRLKKLLKQ